MAASSTVTTGDIATAASYNNLRADVLSNSASHTHTGASDNSIKVNSNDLQGTTLASTVVASSLTSVGTLTTLTVDSIIINGTNIGHTSDTDAIAIASSGVVTMNQIPVFSAGINVSGGTIAGTLSTAAQANITSVGTLTDLTVSGTSTTIGTVTSGIWQGTAIAAGYVATLNQDTTGTAALATSFTVTANNSTAEWVYPIFVDGTTGTQGAETDSALYYNPSTGNFYFDGDISAQSSRFVTSSTGSSAVLTIGAHGTHNAVLNTPESFFINIDSNNGQTDRYFAIAANGTTDGTTPVFKVMEDGRTSVVTGSGGADPNTSYDDIWIDGGATAGISISTSSANGYSAIQFGDDGASADNGFGYAFGTGGEKFYWNRGGSRQMELSSAGLWLFNTYLYDVGHADSYWTNDGAKFASANVGAKVYITSSATNSYPSIRMVNDALEWRIYAPDGSTNDGFHVYDGTNAKYRFSIGTGGEIGFNCVAFDSWITTAGSGYTPVHLGSKQSSIHGTNYDSTGSWTGWQQNAYLDSGDSRWEYVTTGTGATNIYQYNGNIYFRAAASGTADAAITWSIPLHINTSGVTLNNFALYDVGKAESEWSDGWLNVAGTTNSFIDIMKGDAGTGNLRWMNGVNEKFRLWLDNAEARLAISSDGGTNNVFYVERSSGDTYTNDGTIHSISDSRLKKEIVSLDDGLSIINQLRPVTYKYNGTSNMVSDDDVIRYGLVADEVQSVASQYVKTISAEVSGKEVDDLKTLSTTNMIPMLIKAIQELSERVETLES